MAKTPLEAWIKAKIGVPAHGDLTVQALSFYQLDKLRAIVDYVKCRSPFYRRHFSGFQSQSVQVAADLAMWPMTTADDLIKNPLAFLCISQSSVERVVTLPARTVGERPRRFFFSASDLELAVDFFYHGFSTLLSPGQRMLVLMPFGRPYSVGDMISRALARLSVSAIPHGLLQSPDAALEAVLSHGIDSLVGVASQMAAFSRYPGTARIPPGQIQSIWLGMENASGELTEEISRFWGCPVFQQYGADEMCPGGGVQCQAREGFHLREADLFIEIVDQNTAQPLADGNMGEVVVTTLTRQAMPLVRYKTGHQAAIMTEPCPCGSVLRRLTLNLPKA
jgi:phenylacetate-coenzyme A ligase PaaK-like adenylate-forming protein